ncbi:MAG: phosphonate ABC transporter ATP-binding protein, partial [Hyphomonadaceae bacterium]
MSEYVLETEGLAKAFGARAAVANVNIRLARGEYVGLIGPSGSGKSTFMRLCAGLIAADAGSIRVDGAVVQKEGRLAKEVRALRARIGFVFQQFNLVGRLNALTNVLIGALARRDSFALLWPLAEQQRAMAALERVGVADLAAQRVSTLSGGQQQRVAIARALHQGAKIMLADEPIASLDPVTARRTMDLLSDLNMREGITLLVSLHQVDFAMRYCKRIIALKDGRVVYDGPAQDLGRPLLQEIYGAEIEDAFWIENE